MKDLEIKIVVPREVDKIIKDMAVAETRSRNGQIVHILKEVAETWKQEKRANK